MWNFISRFWTELLPHQGLLPVGGRLESNRCRRPLRAALLLPPDFYLQNRPCPFGASASELGRTGWSAHAVARLAFLAKQKSEPAWFRFFYALIYSGCSLAPRPTEPGSQLRGSKRPSRKDFPDPAGGHSRFPVRPAPDDCTAHSRQTAG